MNHLTILVPIMVIAMISSCTTDPITSNQAEVEASIAEISWSLDSITVDPPKSFVTWTISNISDLDWAPSDWSLHFNQIASPAIVESLPSFIEFSNPSGEYIQAFFSDEVDTLKSGTAMTFSYEHYGHIKRMSNVPQGIFIRFDNKTYDIRDPNITGLDHATLGALHPTDAQQRYTSMSSIKKLETSELPQILPFPQEANLSSTEFITLKNGGQITFPEEMTEDQRFVIVQHLGAYFSNDIMPTDEVQIQSEVDSKLSPESYTLSITVEDGVLINGGSTAGVFYGFQSLIQLIDPTLLGSNLKEITVPTGHIKDQPRFTYRGYMLDVARNFHRKEKVMEILDLMSMYKLNKFHFHIMDDEGWRLEIPDLPELTDVGGTRGYTADESDHLRPAYGSGGHPESSYGTGYYTRDEYIDIIKYAHARHIEVIPEIDLPGHARAAIISMRARYNRLMAEGKEDEAEKYLLHDPQDISTYKSAQNYNDNVINLCRESSYTFIDKVIRETIKMHEDAGVPMKTLHTGGDEVPYGAWVGSPMCQSFISDMENLSGTDDLHPNMLFFIRSILNEYNIVTAGWEEIVLAHTAEGHNGTAINEDMVGEPMLPYVWNASLGSGREDMAYKLANSGFNAVMCNSASYYFDLAYDSDPREIGLDWSGLTNAKTAFDLEPLDVMGNATHDLYGNRLSQDYINSKDKLDANAIDKIQGIQAQLWSETLYKAELVDYMTFPKLLGFAQRAWSSATSDYQGEYEEFVNAVGQRELNRLDGYRGRGVNYRIPPPGINITDGQVRMNVVYPGLDIRYTTDGSEPTRSGSLYDAPIAATTSLVIKAKAFNSKGRGSKTSTLK